MLHYDAGRGLSDLSETVQKTASALKPHASEFDSIAVQGTSGLLIGSPVSLMLGKPLVIVREDTELRCWHSHDVENAANAGSRVLFLDDQISSGTTLRDVQAKLRKHTDGRVAATYLYQYDEYSREEGGRNTVPNQRTSVNDILEQLRGNMRAQEQRWLRRITDTRNCELDHIADAYNGEADE